MSYLGTKPANSPLTSELIPDGLIGTSDLANSSVTTDKIVNAAVTPAKLSQPLTLDTAKTATGTSVEFTGIPSWVKRVTILLQGVSGSALAPLYLQVGTSGGLVTTGYLSGATYVPTAGSLNPTTYFAMDGASLGAASLRNGIYTLINITGNTWVFNGTCNNSNDSAASVASGHIALSGTLTRLSFAFTSGSFDAGTINIMYEG